MKDILFVHVTAQLCFSTVRQEYPPNRPIASVATQNLLSVSPFPPVQISVCRGVGTSWPDAICACAHAKGRRDRRWSGARRNALVRVFNRSIRANGKRGPSDRVCIGCSLIAMQLDQTHHRRFRSLTTSSRHALVRTANTLPSCSASHSAVHRSCTCSHPTA